MAEKTLNIGGIDVALKCTGATSVLYRMEFGKDLFVAFNRYATSINEGEIPEGAIDMLEEAAYIMARQANPQDKRTYIEWLDQFDNPMALVEDIGQVAELIVEDRKTTSDAKKKNEQQQEK